jgi:hypothetical protein
MIVWGTKHVRSKQGRVADFCPMCREVRAFGVIRTNSVGHIYFIPLGSGRTIAVTAECETCGHEMSRDPTSYHALAPKRSKDDLGALVKKTFPDVTQVYAERLELEGQIRKSPESLQANVRSELIREALTNVSPAVERIYARTNLDGRFGACLLTALVAMFLLPFGTMSSDATLQSIASAAVGIVVCVALLAAVYFAATSNGRTLRTKVMPRLMTALRPLRPRESELEALLGRFKAAGLKVGKKLRAREIAAAIDPVLVDKLAP